MTEKKLFFGLRKSKEEPHDKILRYSCECTNIDFPIKFSLKDKVKIVYDQLNLNSCSANAAANFIKMSDTDNLIKCDAISRLYLYFCTRWIDNDYKFPIQDQGATLKSVFKALEKYNYIDEDKYPYLTTVVNDVPYKHIFEEALTINKCPILSYKQIFQTKSSIKCSLYKLQKPVLFGMQVYNEFFNITKENDILSMHNENSELIGAHAVVIVGFDDATDTFEILNSHGSKFGNEGYFRMPYSYALNPELAFEFYICN